MTGAVIIGTIAALLLAKARKDAKGVGATEYNKMNNIKDTLPKHTNAFDGEKAHNDSVYITVGRFTYGGWESKAMAVTDIIISERKYVHIQNDHETELNKLGLNSVNFVDLVMQNYNEIWYNEERQSYYLAVMVEEAQKKTGIKCAIIELKEKYEGYDKVYEIITSLPIKLKDLLKNKRLCVKPRT